MKPHVFLVIKVPVAVQAEANALAAQFDYDVGGDETFTGSGYNTSGLSVDPTEFYIVRVAVRPDVVAALDGIDLPEGAEIYSGATLESVVGDLKRRGSSDE